MTSAPHVDVEEFGRLADGRMVRRFTLHNGRGLSLAAINLGGIVTALHAPDRDGVPGNIVLGFASLVALPAQMVVAAEKAVEPGSSDARLRHLGDGSPGRHDGRRG